MPHVRKANVQFRHSGKWYYVDGLVFPGTVPFLWNVRTHIPSNTASHTRRHESSTKLLRKPCITQSTSSRSRSPLSTETTCNTGFLFHILDGIYFIQLLTCTVKICRVSWLYDTWLWWDNRQYDFSLGKTWCCHPYCPTMSLLFQMLTIFYIPFFYMALSISFFFFK